MRGTHSFPLGTPRGKTASPLQGALHPFWEGSSLRQVPREASAAASGAVRRRCGHPPGRRRPCPGLGRAPVGPAPSKGNSSCTHGPFTHSVNEPREGRLSGEGGALRGAGPHRATGDPPEPGRARRWDTRANPGPLGWPRGGRGCARPGTPRPRQTTPFGLLPTPDSATSHLGERDFWGAAPGWGAPRCVALGAGRDAVPRAAWFRDPARAVAHAPLRAHSVRGGHARASAAPAAPAPAGQRLG